VDIRRFDWCVIRRVWRGQALCAFKMDSGNPPDRFSGLYTTRSTPNLGIARINVVSRASGLEIFELDLSMQSMHASISKYIHESRLL
jgi:hypothetical protein